jgi:hypothetical protein
MTEDDSATYRERVHTSDIVAGGSLLLSLTLLVAGYSSLAPVVLLAGTIYYVALWGPRRF